MKRILVVRNDKIGDFMLAWPSFAMLKRSMECHVTALVPAYTAPLGPPLPMDRRDHPGSGCPGRQGAATRPAGAHQGGRLRCLHLPLLQHPQCQAGVEGAYSLPAGTSHEAGPGALQPAPGAAPLPLPEAGVRIQPGSGAPLPRRSASDRGGATGTLPRLRPREPAAGARAGCRPSQARRQPTLADGACGQRWLGQQPLHRAVLAPHHQAQPGLS